MSEIDDKQMDKKEKKDEEPVESESKSLANAEKDEEAKLRTKYPEMKGSGASALLQKRLSKGQPKYFDSGDYNMAKAKTGSSKPPIGTGQKVLLSGSTGDAIPTPDSVPQRKISFNQKKLIGMS